jgi:hypothetical protein
MEMSYPREEIWTKQPYEGYSFPADGCIGIAETVAEPLDQEHENAWKLRRRPTSRPQASTM